MKKSYSLSTILLLMVIVSLAMSQIIMLWRFSDVKAELELNRRRFGYIRVEDEALTYVAQILEPNDEIGTSFRIRVPAGSRYLLHLTDTTFDGLGYPVDPVPKKSISLNGWRDGADVVLSYCIYWENSTPRLNVHTETQEFFNYVPSDWENLGPSDEHHLEANPQSAYSVDETIPIMWWRDTTTKRGLMLWLEPHSKWNEKRLALKPAAEEPNVSGSE